MIEGSLPPTEEELHAYVDAQLPPERRQEIEAWLLQNPEQAARVAHWRLQAEAIRARYGDVLHEAVPAHFALNRLAPRGARFRVAAALALLIAGALTGWLARGAYDGAPTANAVAAEAIDAHKIYVVEVRHPVEVPGSEEAHLVQWLSRRVGHELRAPDLQAIGLKLVGGRLLPGPKGAAAFFMYEGASGERFTLYCARASAPETALRYREDGAVAAFYWIEGEFGYVVSGPAERSRLHTVAQAAYEQLEARAAGRGRSS